MRLEFVIPSANLRHIGRGQAAMMVYLLYLLYLLEDAVEMVSLFSGEP